MNSAIRQAYVNTGSDEAPVLMHYRQCGQGPALIMLHASPLSSATLIPMMEVLAPFVTVIAPDTPGYGYSDPLARNPRDISDYCLALEKFCATLGLANAGLYGTATGAQIAIEYSKRNVDSVDYLILDNAATFSEAEVAGITDGYFPDLRPDEFGAHLVKTWTIARDQGIFFPWNKREERTRLPAASINTDLVQMLAMECLRAGPGYDQAYRAAFANEKLERLQLVATPTTIIRWQGSILKPYMNRFDDIDLPDNFSMAHCGTSREDRIGTLVNTVREYAEGCKAVAEIKTSTRSCRKVVRRFVDFEEGQLHLLEGGAESQPAVLIVHNIGESSAAVSDMAQALSQSSHVIAPDLPGHGASTIEIKRDIKGIDSFAEALVRLLDKLHVKQANILAVADAAAIAVSLCQQAPERAARLCLLNPVDYSFFNDLSDTEQFFPDFVYSSDDRHLLRTWYMLKDKQLFWPWYLHNAENVLGGEPNLNEARLTSRLLDYWASRKSAKNVYQTIIDSPLKQTLQELSVPYYLAVSGDCPVARISRSSFEGEAFKELSTSVAQWIKDECHSNDTLIG